MKLIHSLRAWIQKIELKQRLGSFVSRGKKGVSGDQKELISAGALFAGVVLLILGGVAVALLNTNKSEDPAIVDANEPGNEMLRHPLTGYEIDEELDRLPQVFGVMVENGADAWPLSGLDKAFLVFEAPVEGSIPRFLAFYEESTDVEKVGPVRSARPYYLDWNDELSAMYVHVGGSPEALDLIKYTYDTIDLNQFWYGQYFYRDTRTRSAPHNVYTDGALLRQALERLDVEAPEYDLWKFKDGESNNEEGETVQVSFANFGSQYNVKWEYQPETNDYLRYQGRNVMKMTDGAEITVENLAFIETTITVIDNVGRRRIVTVGEGDAYVAQDGELLPARWKKDERTGRLRFYTPEGDEIAFNAGQSWITVVDSLDKVSGNK